MRLVMAMALGLLLCVSTASAATSDIAKGMGDKALRGAVNLCTGIVEVPVQVYKGCQQGYSPFENGFASKPIGAVLGFFRGLSYAAGRTAWGALELAGFWTANPKDNEGVGIPLDAQYAWEEGAHYSITEPTPKHGLKPVARKLGYGVLDAFLGIAEVPGQTLIGKDQGNIPKGFARGVWFWLSREMYGVTNIATCILPNPPDNPGYPFYGSLGVTALQERGAAN